MPGLLEAVLVQCRDTEKIWVVSRSRDATGPLEGVGPHHSHPLCSPPVCLLSLTSLALLPLLAVPVIRYNMATNRFPSLHLSPAASGGCLPAWSQFQNPQRRSCTWDPAWNRYGQCGVGEHPAV